MNLDKKNMAVVVIGFDGYSDLWDNYFELLNKYWKDRSYSVYLVNNEKQPEYENVEVINCGKDAEWSRKVQVALDKVDEEYICLLLEDFFTKERIDNCVIEDTIKLLKEENIKYCKLENFSNVRTPKYNNIEHMHIIPGDMEYGISLQPAIWHRDFLKKLIGTENYNAWIFEYDRVKESEKNTNEALEGCVFDSRNILKIEHGVVQGKFLPTAVKCFKKQEYTFKTDIRPIMNKKEHIYYLAKNKGKHFVPKKYRGTVKRCLNILGMEFVSDKFK